MKVIGAGLSRTGTATLRAAFEVLLDQPCYHMEVVLREDMHLARWHALATDAGPMDWEALLDGFGAGVDMPICLFVPELMEAFPDAKVVLSTREPEDWFRSWRALVRTNLLLRPMGRLVPKIRRTFEFFDGLILDPLFQGQPLDHDVAIAFLHAHEARIRELVPPERLLVYRVEEGWEPLCDFLDLPVPDEPFPHLNAGMGSVRQTLGQIFGVPL